MLQLLQKKKIQLKITPAEINNLMLYAQTAKTLLILVGFTQPFSMTKTFGVGGSKTL